MHGHLVTTAKPYQLAFRFSSSHLFELYLHPHCSGRVPSRLYALEAPKLCNQMNFEEDTKGSKVTLKTKIKDFLK